MLGSITGDLGASKNYSRPDRPDGKSTENVSNLYSPSNMKEPADCNIDPSGDKSIQVIRVQAIVYKDFPPSLDTAMCRVETNDNGEMRHSSYWMGAAFRSHE
jgi:hypothetical protein